MRNMIKIFVLVLIVGVSSINAVAQETGRPQRRSPHENLIAQQEEVKAYLDRVFDYLNETTPPRIVNRETAQVVRNLRNIDSQSVMDRGDFGISTYEWGVTYSGMLKVAEYTGDQRYADYTYDRLRLLGEAYPHFRRVHEETGRSGLRGLVAPIWLDDCGSMGAAMMKTSLVNPALSGTLRPVIDNAFDFVMYKEHRLHNRILARLRPTTNSVWLDDMYMGIPPIAYMAKILEEEDPEKAEFYYNEAALQVDLFKQILWIPEKNLFSHGWIERMEEHPSFYWARANGWALLAMSDVLDILPKDHIAWNQILELFKSHIQGLVELQSGEGLWHQLLNRNDSYLETSATAMFTYCIAHAINEGWIDEMVYGPIARFGWRAVTTQINERGQVENTCVGTGLEFWAGFYYNRPVNVLAPHGYGPVLLAGSEMYRLLENSIAALDSQSQP